jgi:hypothetical protein
VERAPHPIPSQLPAALVERPPHPPDAVPVGLLADEPCLYLPALLTCRCGRYLSEDFDGRLFCRVCEGYDPADLTPRIAGLYRGRQQARGLRIVRPAQ